MRWVVHARRCAPNVRSRGRYQKSRRGIAPNLADPLMTIADLSQVWVRRKQEKTSAIKSVRRRLNHAGCLSRQTSWTGKVLFVGDLLRPETRTIRFGVMATMKDDCVLGCWIGAV